MRRLANYIFDSYDDVGGEVLQSIIETPEELPLVVKTASRLTSDQIEKLSDDNFALIVVDGADILKKYATIDEGNTVMSVLYLLKQAHLLPSEVVKTAAKNLILACNQYDITPPGELKIAAETGTSPSSQKKQTSYSKNTKVDKIKWPFSEEPKEEKSLAFGGQDAATADVDQRTNMQGVPGTNYLELPLTPKEKVKTAHEYETVTRQKAVREQSYFDLTSWDPSKAFTEEISKPVNTLLEGSYPVDTYEQVKLASKYIENNWMDFHPRKRHEYCTKLASRMHELGIQVPEDVERYGSSTYAADSDVYVNYRRSCTSEDAHEVIDMLLEKKAQVSPQVFAEALCEFDKANNLDWYWGGQIADPWFSTFGPSIEKLAEEDWSFCGMGIRINDEDLEYIARNEHERICKSFGSSFAKEFSKNPKTVFNSLPTPNKLIIARLASARHDSIP